MIGRWRFLLLGLWMSFLYWPFAHAGGYRPALVLSFAPLLLSVGDLFSRWVLRILVWLFVLYADLCLAWGHLTGFGHIGRVIGGAIAQMLLLPPQQWNHISAQIAVPILLAGAWVGWLLFRQCTTYLKALVLLAIGTVIIALNHVVWKLPAELALAGYLTVGLLVLLTLFRTELGRGARPLKHHWTQYVGWAAAALLPVGVGWTMPAHAASDPLGLFSGHFVPGLVGSDTATTGFGPGVTDIGRSLTENRTPVFVAHTTRPYYWQAAIYNHFNGSAWSNSRASVSYETSPSSVDIPLIPPYFPPTLPTKTIHATIQTVTGQRTLNTLFYTGVPTAFSILTVVHTASDQFNAQTSVARYGIRAEIPVYNTSKLQDAPFQSPPPALRPDLQIPRNLSPRVAVLASRITEGAHGPWQAAIALKHWLDRHYRYSLTVTPSRRNVVNHFLFVDKKGYCDQFSSAFIMMLRTLHIPARWVVGYSAGRYDPSLNGYVVRSSDAHSWAQVWIDGAGWVPFDPTPGFQLPLSYVTGSASTVHSASGAPPSHVALPPATAKELHRLTNPAQTGHQGVGRSQAVHHRSSRAPSLTWWLGAALAALVLGLLTLTWQRRRRDTSHRVWAGIRRVSHKKLGTRWHAKTPRQWGAQWLRYFPDDQAVIWPLVQLLEASFYRDTPLSDTEQGELQRLWAELRKRDNRSA